MKWRALVAGIAVVVSGTLLAAAADGTGSPSARPVKAPPIGTVIRDCPDCPEMVAVPQLGHTSDKPGKVFYAGRYEVTWREYLMAVRAHACPVPLYDFGKPLDIEDKRINDDYPLTTIGYRVFSCYLNWLNARTGHTYRIPTAREWEHIARAGTTTEYYWGNGLGYNNAQIPDYFDRAAFDRKSNSDPANWFRNDKRSDVWGKRVYPVGLFPPNPWGLYDVIGNASEFTTERSAPTELCLSTKKWNTCDMVNTRGNDRWRLNRPEQPQEPITKSYTTERFVTPAYGGVTKGGFRLVRD